MAHFIMDQVTSSQWSQVCTQSSDTVITVINAVEQTISNVTDTGKKRVRDAINFISLSSVSGDELKENQVFVE